MDLFSSAISWKVNKKSEISTVTGKIISFMIILVVIMFIIYTIIIFSQKKQPNTSITVKFHNGPSDEQLGTLYDEILEVVILFNQKITAVSYPKYTNYERDCSGDVKGDVEHQIKPPFYGVNKTLDDNIQFRYDCAQKRIWPDSSNPRSLTQLATYVGLPDGTCSESVKRVLIESGKDPELAFCFKFDLKTFDESVQVNFTGFPKLKPADFFTCFQSYEPITYAPKVGLCEPFARADSLYYFLQDINKLDIALNLSDFSVCNIIPSTNLEDYERPLKWALLCGKENNVKFRSSVIALRTDNNIIVENYKVLHMRYLKADTSIQDSENFYLFSYRGPLKTEYFEYTRRYIKLVDLFASIKAIWIALVLILYILAKKLMEVEKQLIIYGDMVKNNPELAKIVKHEVKLKDYFMAIIIRNREAQKKIKDMNDILEQKYYSKIEILSLLEDDEAPNNPNINSKKKRVL